MDRTIWISGLVFIVTLLAMIGVFAYIQSKQKQKEWGDRLHGRSKVQGVTKQKDEGITYLKGNLLKILERLGQANKPKDQAETSRIRKTLVTAGYRSPQAPIIFYGSESIFSVNSWFSFFAIWG